MNEENILFLTMTVIMFVTILLLILYLVPVKLVYNKNKFADVNKNLQPFSNYSTSITTSDESNTLDTPESIDEYCSSLNKDGCNTSDKMCVYDGVKCQSRKYNYILNQSQIIGSNNTFHNSKDGVKETLQYKDIIKGVLNQGIRAHCITVTTDRKNTKNEDKMYIIRTTGDNNPSGSDQAYYSDGKKILLSTGLKTLLQMSTDNTSCKNSDDPIILYINMVNTKLTDDMKSQLFNIIMNAIPDFKMKPTSDKKSIVMPNDAVNTELINLKNKILIFSNININMPKQKLNSYLPLVYIDNNKYNGIKNVSSNDISTIEKNKDKSYVVVFPDNNTKDGDLLFIKDQPGIYFNEINHYNLINKEDVLKQNGFDNESIKIIVPETLSIQYKQTKEEDTEIPVTNSSGVKMPVKTVSTTSHTHSNFAEVIPVSK
jgi:hypothetical protein